MDQTIEPLSDGHAQELEAKRSWVRDHYDARSRHKYETIEGKLRLLDTILQNDWVSPEDTVKLQCLGITFGDALAQELGLQWVTVEDEYGRDPALSLQGSSVLVFPMTSISKRVERGETVVPSALFQEALATIREHKGRWT